MRTLFSISTFVLINFFCGISYAWGAEFQPMVGIPGLDTGSRSLPEYLNAIYLFLITIGAVIGVIKIAMAGVKYATTDIGGSKSQAKDDIKSVLLGLLILCLPYLVLSVINPNFTKLDVLKFDTTTNNPSQTQPQHTSSSSYSTSTVSDAKNSGKTKCSYCLSASGTCGGFVSSCSTNGGTVTETLVEKEPNGPGTDLWGFSCWAPSANQCSKMPTNKNDS